MSILKQKTVKIPIYFGDLKIILCDDWEEINQKYNVKLGTDLEAAIFTDDGDYMVLYAVFSRKPKGSVIAHECVHLISQVFCQRGITRDNFNDEPEAYLHGWFFQQIDNFFKNIEK